MIVAFQRDSFAKKRKDSEMLSGWLFIVHRKKRVEMAAHLTTQVIQGIKVGAKSLGGRQSRLKLLLTSS